jgi:hypothetical protein
MSLCVRILFYCYSNCSFTILAKASIGIGIQAKHFTYTLGISFNNSS